VIDPTEPPLLPAWPEGRQDIPRPSGAYPGGPAPWAERLPGDRRGLSLDRLRTAIDLAGEPTGTSLDGFPDPGAPSAVLLALFEEAGEARVILTRRAGHLRSHRGEVSFPGGRLDPGEDPETGALREAEEEIGLDPAAVALAGRLTPLSTFASQSVITPVVGFLEDRPRVSPNPAEVEHVFDVSLAELVAEGVFREERWIRPDRPAPAHVRPFLGPDGSFPVWFFELPEDTVWGVTARVLVELLVLVLGA
jgi:8-oxo-dGTP pyrophosphatase MutT (NUDIX family)